MKKKLFGIFALVLCTLIILVGCKNKDKDNDNSTSGDNTPSTDSSQGDSIPDGDIGAGGDVGEAPSDGSQSSVIYSSTTTLGIRYGEELYELYDISQLCNKLYSVTNLEILSESSAPLEHEIVIGDSDLEISKEAYRRLARVRLTPEQEQDADAYTKCLIYSDGKSIAIAYNEQTDFISLRVAIDYVINNLIRDCLSLEAGNVYSAVTDVYEYYKAEDDIAVEEKWQTLADTLGDDGDGIVTAFKGLYALYSDDLISWLANLYEPIVCVCDGFCTGTPNCIGGGFYYSNSARDTLGYLPDVESTKQILALLDKSGMVTNYAEELPAEIMNDILRWVKSLQAEDGYFYHPQWGTGISSSRRNRDLTNAITIIQAAGARPTYTTPTGIKGDGVLPTSAHLTCKLDVPTATAVSKVVLAAGVTDPNLKDKESFIAYLESLDIKNNSYVAGNILAAYTTVIKARDKELQALGANYSLFDIMIEHLNNTQNPANGTWYWVDKNSSSYSIYAAVNGLMKISCVYEDSAKMMPNADKALQTAMDAIVSLKDVSACVDVYNTWFTINNIFKIYRNAGGADGASKINEARSILIANAPELISATAEKLATFRKTDGSFSYSPRYSAYESQGCLAAVPKTEEGDVNATSLCTTGTVALIYSCLGLDSYFVPMYTHSDFYRFVSIVSDLGQVIKDEFETSVAVENIDNHGIGKYKDLALDFEKTTAKDLLTKGVIATDKPDELAFDTPVAQKNVSIYDVEYEEPHTKALSFKKADSGDPYLYIYADETGSGSYVFEADICIFGGKTGYEDNRVFSFYFYNGDTVWSGSARNLVETGETDNESRAIYGTEVEDRNISAYVWYNIRIEFQDIGTVGSDIRFYINNVLVERKRTTKKIETLTHVAMRFRYDSGAQSTMLLDNVYFSAVNNLEVDNTPLIPPIDIQEIANANDINSEYRGSGAHYQNAVKYENTNATLLDLAGYIGTNGLYYDLKNTAEKNHVKVVSINGNGALNLGKGTGLGDPWLRILKTERRAGSSYVFETDFALMSGAEWRSGDNNLFAFYLAQNETDSIYYGGASGRITVASGEYRLVLYGTDADGNSYDKPLDTSKWYNLRIEISGLTSGSLISYYLNGELIHSSKANGPASGASHMLMRFNVDTTGLMYLDNTYFAATGELLPDEPEVPEEPNPELPDYERGNGQNKNNENTLDFTDKTATELGQSGKLGVFGSAILDGTSMSVSVSDVNGDAALKVHNNVYSSQGYLNMKTDSIGKSYVFEADVMIAAGSSQRSAREILQIFGGIIENGSENFTQSGIPGIRLKAIPKNGVTTYAITSGDEILKVLELGEWFNVRYEFDDWSKTGTAIRVYVNDELAVETVTKATTTAFRYIRLWLVPDATSEIYLDNIYFSSNDDQPEGGDVEITPPTPEDTVKNTANILSTQTGADGIVVLMHDDASSTMYIIDEVFRELDLRGNIAMYPLGAIYTDGVIDWSKVLKWQRYLDTGRWQLSSHSMTHTFPGLTDDEGKITYEVVNSQQVLREAFPSQRILTYAYPGYYAQLGDYGTDRFSAVMREMVGTYYIAGRDSYGNANIGLSSPNVDWTFAPSYQFDESNVLAILDAISKTQNGEMAVLFTHMIAANNDTLSSNTMYEKNLRIICEAVSKLRDEGKVWVAFYEDAVLYTREAQAATVSAVSDANSITVALAHTLDKDIYNYPLTVRVVTPATWEAVKITQGDRVSYAVVKTVAGKTCIDASIVPNAENAIIAPISAKDIPNDEVDTSLTENRGTGVYTDSALDFTGVTAGGLKESGELGADSAVNLDAVAMGVIVVSENGDGALKIGNAWGKVGYIYLNSHTAPGKNYVFETDLKLSSGSTSRSDNVIFQIYASTTKNSVTAYSPISFKIIRADGIYYLRLATKNSEGSVTDVLLGTECWYNLRIEMDDITVGGEVRYYVNGTLVHTGETTAKASELGSMVVWMPQDTSGVIALDNTFFGALDANDSPSEEPDTPEEPSEPDSTESVRGSGEYADNEGALDFTDKTATDLKDTGRFTVGSGSATIDGSGNKNASVVHIGKDNALKFESAKSESTSSYYAIKSSNGTSSGDYVFETDVYVSAATSTRSNYAFLAISDGRLATENANYTPTVLFTVNNGKYQIVVNGTSVATDIACGEWFNFRVEYDDCNTRGAEIRYYVNGTLIGTSANKGATTAFQYIRVGLLDKSTSEVYFDNTYFSTVSK